MAKINPIELSSFRYGLGAFCVKQDRKKRWGIIDRDGNVVVEPCWNMIHICSPEMIMHWTSGRLSGRFFDIVRRKFISGIQYNSFCKRLITIKGNKRGLEDLNGHVLIPHKYKYMVFVKDDLIEVTDFKHKRGVLTVDGKELLPVRYDAIHLCDKTLSFVRVADEWFVADASGERPLKKQYDYLGSFNSKGYCIFGEKQVDEVIGECMCYGLMDKHENILIPAIYDFLHCYWPDDSRFYYGRAARAFWGGGGKMNPRWQYGVIDSQGNEIVPCVYPVPLEQGPDRTYIADIPRMNYGKGEVAYQPVDSQTGYVTGVVDETGRIVLPFRNWQIHGAYNTAAYRVYDRELERYGLYSSSGEELLPLEFEYIDVMGDTLDYIAVCKNGEWYYVNSRNERVLL